MKILTAAIAFLVTGLAHAQQGKKEILFLDSVAYKAYLVKYCDNGNECTSGDAGQFKGAQNDCAHFVAHALLAGGVKADGKEPVCNKGLLIRAIDLSNWLSSAAGRYANVRQITDWKDTQALDIGFVQNFYVRRWSAGFDSVHALVLAEPSKESGGKFYAHTNNRCGLEEVDYRQIGVGPAIVFYRIEPSPLDGKTWVISGAGGNSRFVLKFNGRKVTWQEKGIEKAASQQQTLDLVLEDSAVAGSYVIRRANDDATLKLLSFTDPKLRSQIIAANPEPSTLTLSLNPDKGLSAEWRGLRVKKKKDESLDQLTQPSVSAPMQLQFVAQ